MVALCRVFPGYACEDRDAAAKIAATLESEGWSMWWDMKIPAGHTLDGTEGHKTRGSTNRWATEPAHECLCDT